MGHQTDAMGGAGATCSRITSNIRSGSYTTVVGIGIIIIVVVVVILNVNSSIRFAALDIIGGPSTTKHVPETAGLHGRR